MMLGASSALNGLRFPLPSAHRFRNLSRGTKPMLFSPPLSASASSSTSDQPKSKPWLLVGLGNPGKMYTGTRHNVGFEMIDAIAEAEGISVSTIRFKALFGKGFIGDAPVMLAKPQTFMNASGESVGSIVSYFNVPLNQVVLVWYLSLIVHFIFVKLVIIISGMVAFYLQMYDDLDLPFAKLRLLPKGGHGGHNGMKSVINHLKGSRDFPRLRMGIGRPPGKMDSASFVLRPFNKKEREELDFALQRGLEAIRILLVEGLNKSATFVNSSQPSELMNR